MKFVLFYHSFSSCWNHGNAHFLRGIARELLRLGHDVTVYEQEDGWSRVHALDQGGAEALQQGRALVPGTTIRSYRGAGPDVDEALDGADAVIVHEWTRPELVAAIGRRRACGASFTLMFHDTHHRAITAPQEIDALDLEGYDGVLAFGEVLREVYVRRGWARRAFTWHEAADTELFRPIARHKECDLVWIGNWGDGERTRELCRYLITPAANLGIATSVYGVRYPAAVLRLLALNGMRYCGWLPNHRTPEAFAAARVTIHVPRRPYVEALPGIPTIRVFEALACGIPLVCSPWHDAESLFPAGCYLTAQHGHDMRRAISSVLEDQGLAAELARCGLKAIKARHSCAHRAFELLGILKKVRQKVEPSMAIKTGNERVPAP